MRQIFLILLLSTMLFSAQRQVILGCYLNEANAQKEIQKLNALMISDSKLKKLMERNSLKGELKKVGDYNVITLAPFNTYGQLFLGLDLLKTHYSDSYVLEYPFSKKIVEEKFIAPKKETLVVKGKDQKIVIEEKVDAVEEEITQEVLVEEIEAEPVVENIPEIAEVKKEITYEQPTYEELVSEEPVSLEPVEKKSEKETYYIEYGLGLVALLVLLAVGLLIYARSQKEEVNEWDFKS